MSSKANTTAEELLKLQTNAKEVHKDDSPLIERIEIPTTPFIIVGNKTVGYMLTYGKYQLTEYFDTVDKVQVYLNENTWIITERLIGCMIHFNENNP